MKARSLLCVAAATFAFASVLPAAIADTIEVPLSGTLSSFGSFTPYRGQTFQSLSTPSIAEAITVFVGPSLDPGARFHLLLTEVDRSSGFHPTTVLFESATLSVPFSLGTTAFAVDLQDVLLQADTEYAWILDYFVVAAPGRVSMDTGIQLPGTYPGGEAFDFPTGPFLPSGTRSDHFASSNWFLFPFPPRDLAFTLELTPVAQVPEPPSLLLLLSGCCGVYFLARQSPKANADAVRISRSGPA
jgi:hypothetical protein